jgi:hypothetical protein
MKAKKLSPKTPVTPGPSPTYPENPVITIHIECGSGGAQFTGVQDIHIHPLSIDFLDFDKANPIVPVVRRHFYYSLAPDAPYGRTFTSYRLYFGNVPAGAFRRMVHGR